MACGSLELHEAVPTGGVLRILPAAAAPAHVWRQGWSHGGHTSAMLLTAGERLDPMGGSVIDKIGGMRKKRAVQH